MDKINNGTFLISLDFELQWGVFDVLTIDEYRENLANTRNALNEIIKKSNHNNIRLTLATVGFLFAKNKEELKPYIPKITPSYTQPQLYPYKELKKIGQNEHDPSFYFAQDIIKEIVKNDAHEICTHTFSHYYCRAAGQSIEEFEADLIAAKRIGQIVGVEPKSIVFPRNQINSNYLKICHKHGITSYRGIEKSFAYKESTNSNKIITIFHSNTIKRALRLLDSYINIFGHSTYNINLNNKNKCLDLPSSRFLRPYNMTLSSFEFLKIRRIKKAMTYAAKNNELYHLWWHPHNFGKNIPQNLSNLEKIYRHYRHLNKKYGFKSETMHSFTEKINQ